MQNGKKYRLQKGGERWFEYDLQFPGGQFLVAEWESCSNMERHPSSGTGHFYYHYFNSSTQTETIAKAPEAPENSF